MEWLLIAVFFAWCWVIGRWVVLWEGRRAKRAAVAELAQVRRVRREIDQILEGSTRFAERPCRSDEWARPQG